MVDIQFQNIDRDAPLSALAKNSVQAAFKYLNLPISSEASILFCDDAIMMKLNKDHQNIEAATDVLSFPNEGRNPESGGDYLGDIAISVERASQQAKRGGHLLEDEIQLLVVHGLLHLLGYQHHNMDQKNKMWDVQNGILDALGNNIDQEKIGADE